MIHPLLLVAHGSSDPRFAATVEALADRLRGARCGLDVSVAYLEHGPPPPPDLGNVVVVPLLLTSGYHARVDLPGRAPGARITRAIGPDPRLAAALAGRLTEAGYDGTGAVTLAAAGSNDPRALADVELTAGQLADRLGAPVTPAYVSAGRPQLPDLRPRVVASYLLAPGVFHDEIAGCGADVVGAPLGDHPQVVETVLARYDEAS